MGKGRGVPMTIPGRVERVSFLPTVSYEGSFSTEMATRDHFSHQSHDPGAGISEMVNYHMRFPL